MATHTSITQICNAPPKRLIHLVIFILIGLKCYQAVVDPFERGCWHTRRDHRYLDATGSDHATLEECKNYCEKEMQGCHMIVFDSGSSTSKCSHLVTNIDKSKIEGANNVHMYILDLDCSRKVPSCWTTKGDYNFLGLQSFDKTDVTLAECKQHCLTFPDCDVITYIPYGSEGPTCFTRTEAGQLDRFGDTQGGIITYVLNKTCQQASSVAPGAKTVNPNATDGPPDSDAKSSGGSMVMILLVLLILIGVLAGAGFFGFKQFKAKPAKIESTAPPTASEVPTASPPVKTDADVVSISSKK